MTKFIPIFPLGMVVFPTDTINLHIFEPRYKQLIADCVNQQTNFAIGTFLSNELQEFACVVSITEIIKTYDNGEMDIRIKGQEVCRILQLIDQVPNKMYQGAIVNYPENILDPSYPHKLQKVKSKMASLFKLLNITKTIEAENNVWSSYSFGHYCGLKLKDEYAFLCILNEDERLDFILYYLQEMQNNSLQIENINNKVKLNGHFRLNK